MRIRPALLLRFLNDELYRQAQHHIKHYELDGVIKVLKQLYGAQEDVATFKRKLRAFKLNLNKDLRRQTYNLQYILTKTVPTLSIDEINRLVIFKMTEMLHNFAFVNRQHYLAHTQKKKLR